MKLLKHITFKILFWALIPFLLVVGIVPFFAQMTLINSALDVVRERDAAFAEIAGVRLSENLQKYSFFLQTLAGDPVCREMAPKKMDALKVHARTRLHFFDGGIYIFDRGGDVVWAYPDDGAGRNLPTDQTLLTDGDLEQLEQNLRPVFSNIFFHEFLGSDALIIAVPILDDYSEFIGVMAGVCSVQFSTLGTTYTRVLEFKSGKSSFGYLVDGNGRVVYHRHSSLLGRNLMKHEAVRRVVNGEVGAVFSKRPFGAEIVLGFAPVPGTGWGVVTQGNWTEIEQLIHFYVRLFAAVLWAGGGISALLVFFFIRRTMTPVKALTIGADRIAQGDFIEIPVKRTGDDIETLTLQFNSMARALKASFANIRTRVDALNEAQAALRRSEERISGIINSVTDVMMMIHENGDVLWLNDKGKEVFGKQAEGGPYSNLLYPGRKQPRGCIVRQCFQTGIETDTELALTVDGRKMDYWCTSNVVQRAREGTPRRVVLVCRNLAEKKRMRQEVLRNAQLAALGELAAGVAHEINNPINGIINYAQIIEDTRGTGRDDPGLPQRIIAEGMRIANIVSKLLSFARSGSEVKKAVDLPEVIDDVLELTRAMIRKDRIQVVRHIPDHLPRATAVVHQIQQIFLNVIGNARYALNQRHGERVDGKQLTITCSLEMMAGGPGIRTVFEDNGTGIPEAIMDKLCNPFFSTKPPDQGTGLGLSISYGIIEEHQGELSIESEEGEWTRVTIDLPAHAPQVSQQCLKRPS